MLADASKYPSAEPGALVRNSVVRIMIDKWLKAGMLDNASCAARLEKRPRAA
jgi:hypothetical protein